MSNFGLSGCDYTLTLGRRTCKSKVDETFACHRFTRHDEPYWDYWNVLWVNVRFWNQERHKENEEIPSTYYWFNEVSLQQDERSAGLKPNRKQ